MMRLIIGNRNYSSWSLRAWLVAARCGMPLEVVRLPLDTPEFAARVHALSPSGRVPALQLDGFQVWDSLAIAETLAERFPAAGLWPADAAARAEARAISAEMHAGFGALRRELPMNIRARRRVDVSAAAAADIARVCGIWASCRARFAAEGPWLFGAWSIADAMYAPVVTRFVTYGVGEAGNDGTADAPVAAYIRTTCAEPLLAAWSALAREEIEVVEADEAGVARDA
jgi:glutathione S-transferase